MMRRVVFLYYSEAPMYDTIGRWVVAVLVTLGISVGLLFLLQRPLGIKMSADVLTAVSISCVVAVSTGPIADYILKATKKKS